MSENPYQSPATVEAESPEMQAALARVAPVGLAIRVFGMVYFAFGVWMFCVGIAGFFIRLYQSPASLDADFLASALGITGLSLVAVAVGTLGIVLGGKLRRLDSIRGAYGAIALGFVLYPACILTLPLSLYGLWVLRRPGVKSVLAQRAAARKQSLHPSPFGERNRE
jgi:hypothetical protein